MKVLIIAGNPVGKYGQTEDLARVWQDDKHRIYVEPANFAKVEFAIELQNLIDQRIEANSETPFFNLAAEYEGSLVSDKLQAILPSDPDFLDNFMGEVTLFGWGAPDNIAGYEVSNSSSRIIEE